MRDATILVMSKKLLCTVLAVLALMATSLFAAASKPKSVIHVITVKWKEGTTDAQIASALKAAESINHPGLVRVWTRPIKMQLPEGFKNIIVMEFQDEGSLKKYADSPAQAEWYKVYMPIRGESATHDITN